MSWVRAIVGASGSAVAPEANVRALRESVALLWRHRALCFELIRRDLGSQFAGQAFGRFWIFGHPLILFGVYVFIFTIVLNTRISSSQEMPRDYTTYILTGLAPWLATQQVLARGPAALIGQASLVKQVVFPIEVLPLGAVIGAGIPLLVGIGVILARLIFLIDVPITILLLPLAILIHATFMLGLAYVLSAVTPFFRDVKDVVSAFTVIGVYLIPAFYLPQWVPASLQPILYFNPFSYIIWMYQDVLYFGTLAHPMAWLVSIIMAAGTLALGARTFRKLKPFVANVL